MLAGCYWYCNIAGRARAPRRCCRVGREGDRKWTLFVLPLICDLRCAVWSFIGAFLIMHEEVEVSIVVVGFVFYFNVLVMAGYGCFLLWNSAGSALALIDVGFLHYCFSYFREGWCCGG